MIIRILLVCIGISSNLILGSATTNLRHAIKTGNIAHMQQCIEQGADVNDRDGCDWPHAGRTMLTDAIDNKSVEAVELLLRSGASVEEISDIPSEYNKLKPATRNVPQLSYAIIVNAPLEIIKLLIQYSKNIDAPDIYIGWTPYAIAQYYKHIQAMDLLSQAGANTDICGSQ